MRVESVGLTDELLIAAKCEFLKNGFINESLRQIAKACNVSTNSIYTKFKDKEGLFDAIIANSANELMRIYINCTNLARRAIDSNEVINIGDDGTNDVLKCIYDHFDDFKLIFCCSNGTKYENYFDELAEIEEDFYKEFCTKFSNRKIDDFFIHIICRNGWQLVYDLVSHNKSFSEAINFMNDVTLFNHYGWMKVLGIN